MMKILLAEDEPPILRDIKMLIEQCSADFKVCATAYNGQQALAYLEQASVLPDLLITDIQMPVISGLELIRQVKKKYPSVTCIILTGYGEFSYAQEALRLGVTDYLLKPVDEQALEELLTKIYHEKQLQKVQHQLHYNHVRASDTAKLQPGFYAVALLCTCTIPMLESSSHEFTTTHDNTDFMEQTLQNLLDPQDTFWIIDGRSPVEQAIIFNLHSSDEKKIREFFLRFFRQICPKVPFLSMGVDLTIKNINETGASLRNLRHFLVSNILLEQPQLLFYPEESGIKNTQGTKLQTELIQKLTVVFSGLQVQLFQSTLKSSLDSLQKARLPQNQLFQFIYDLLSACLASLSKDSIEPDVNIMESANDTLFLSRTYHQLYCNLSSVFEDIFESLLSDFNNGVRKDQVCLLLDNYIKKNYADAINTQTLADQFGFSPAYLSKVFREYKNISPMEYIIHLRIEKAKQLFLESPSILIKDVSLAVGYEDPQYFSKVFKKMTGLSPRQFINQFHLS